jgi:hypothetical protein
MGNESHCALDEVEGGEIRASRQVCSAAAWPPRGLLDQRIRDALAWRPSRGYNSHCNTQRIGSQRLYVLKMLPKAEQAEVHGAMSMRSKAAKVMMRKRQRTFLSPCSRLY